MFWDAARSTHSRRLSTMLGRKKVFCSEHIEKKLAKTENDGRSDYRKQHPKKRARPSEQEKAQSLIIGVSKSERQLGAMTEHRKSRREEIRRSRPQEPHEERGSNTGGCIPLKRGVRHEVPWGEAPDPVPRGGSNKIF